jgi:hypothetical protein
MYFAGQNDDPAYGVERLEGKRNEARIVRKATSGGDGYDARIVVGLRIKCSEIIENRCLSLSRLVSMLDNR